MEIFNCIQIMIGKCKDNQFLVEVNGNHKAKNAFYTEWFFGF
jgi:hypothetical protein